VSTEAVAASGAVVTAALAAAGQHVSYSFVVETSLWAPSAHPTKKQKDIPNVGFAFYKFFFSVFALSVS
jgi:hypothetical protein